MPMASLAPETRAHLVLGAFFAAVFGGAFGLITSPIHSVFGAAYGVSCAFVFRHIRRSPIVPSTSVRRRPHSSRCLPFRGCARPHRRRGPHSSPALRSHAHTRVRRSIHRLVPVRPSAPLAHGGRARFTGHPPVLPPR